MYTRNVMLLIYTICLLSAVSQGYFNLHGSFGEKFLTLLNTHDLLKAPQVDANDPQEIAQSVFKQKVLDVMKTSDIFLLVPFEDDVFDLDFFAQLGEPSQSDKSLRALIESLLPESVRSQFSEEIQLCNLKNYLSLIDVRKLLLKVLIQINRFETVLGVKVFDLLDRVDLRLPCAENIAKELNESGFFLEQPLGEKIYMLLDKSAEKELAFFEDVCTFLIGCMIDIDKKSEWLAKMLTLVPNKIDTQGLSGRTVIMLLIEGSYSQFKSYSHFKAKNLHNDDGKGIIIAKTKSKLPKISPKIAGSVFRRSLSFTNVLELSARSPSMGRVPTLNIEHSALFVARKLIDRGANVKVKDKKGRTALHYAAIKNISHFYQLLIQCGALVADTDAQGDTAFHLAISEKERTLGPLRLIYRPRSSITDRLDHEFLDTLPPIIVHNASFLYPSKHSHESASYETEISCREFILMIDINIRNCKGNTPLHRAVAAGDTRATKLLLDKGSQEDAKYLIDKNALNVLKQTPLHLACIANNGIASILLGKSASTILIDSFGNQPLHYACASGVQIELFSEVTHADENRANSAGWRPLHIACYFGNTEAVHLLLRGFYNLNGNDNEIVPTEINAQIPTSGKTPLMIACEKGHEDICKILVTQESLDPDARDRVLGTALDWACELEHVKVCKILLESRFINQTNWNKALLLYRTCKNNNRKLQELFFKKWKLWDAVDESGNTVLHIACSEGLSEVVELLLHNFTPKALGIAIRNRKGKTAKLCALGREHIIALLDQCLQCETC